MHWHPKSKRLKKKLLSDKVFEYQTAEGKQFLFDFSAYPRQRLMLTLLIQSGAIKVSRHRLPEPYKLMHRHFLAAVQRDYEEGLRAEELSGSSDKQ